MGSPNFCSRRDMVQAVLSPPTVSLSRFPVKNLPRPPHPKEGVSHGMISCCLCHSEEEMMSSSSVRSVPVPLVREAVRSMMSQVGLTLEEGFSDLTFCSFCHTQLQSLLSLKREMDGIAERLASMIFGLHGLLSSSRGRQEEEGQEGSLGQLDSQQSADPMSVQIMDDPVPCNESDFFEEDNNSCTGYNEKKEDPGFPVCDEESSDSDDDIEDVKPNVSILNLNLKPQGKGKRFPCTTCHKTYREHNTLVRHTLTHLPEADRPFPCPHCPRRFCRSTTLKIHTSTHLPEDQRPRPFVCSVCPASFPLKHKLDRHSLGHLPPKERPFGCPKCDRRFIRRETLRVHVKKTHVESEDEDEMEIGD